MIADRYEKNQFPLETIKFPSSLSKFRPWSCHSFGIDSSLFNNNDSFPLWVLLMVSIIYRSLGRSTSTCTLENLVWYLIQCLAFPLYLWFREPSKWIVHTVQLQFSRTTLGHSHLRTVRNTISCLSLVLALVVQYSACIC